MSENKEAPEIIRERLRQDEIKRNPTVNLSDAFNRTGTGNFVDLIGSLGWKSFGILILVIMIVFVLASMYLK